MKSGRAHVARGRRADLTGMRVRVLTGDGPCAWGAYLGIIAME
jgi:hypothetical protein